MKNTIATLALAAACLSAPMAHAQTREERAAEKAENEKLGSLYLRCDGEPNNMTGGETFARFLGAITLLGLFAPSPESPDASKRLFGEKGVDACSQLIDGEKAEGNTVRRIPLILARALHNIEAKNYEAALTDVEKARTEAQTADLAGNAYFDRSMGLSFSNIEAEAHLRMGQPAQARNAALAAIDTMKYSFVPMAITSDYGEFNEDFPPQAEAKLAASARIFPRFIVDFADRLERVGRFSDAAEKREALIALFESLEGEDKPTIIYARAALSHALAGQWEQASERAATARLNLASLRAEGKPEDDTARSIEVLDLFDIMNRANNGEVAIARRNFAARSQWVEASFGAVMEVNRRLREEATEDELFGALEATAEEMWTKSQDEKMAVKLQQDTDNKTLFNLIQPYAKVDAYEDRSKRTWRVEKKSKMMTEEPDEFGEWRIMASGDLYSAIDSIVLHAALQARQRGKEGFTIRVSLPRAYRGYVLPAYGTTRFLNRDDDLARDTLFIPADEVIAELSQVIPSPDDLRQIRRERSRKKRNR